jgi:hypothetical protein
MQTAQKLSLYDQLMRLPEGLTGEILNGQLYTQPRPAGPHALVESSLVLGPPCFDEFRAPQTRHS